MLHLSAGPLVHQKVPAKPQLPAPIVLVDLSLVFPHTYHSLLPFSFML